MRTKRMSFGTPGNGDGAGCATRPDPVPTTDQCRRLLELSAGDVHRFVAQRIANKADAEDVAQQALLQAVAKLPSFRSRNFRGWLFTISRHLIIDYYRAKSRVRFIGVEAAALGEAEASLQTRHDAVHAVCDCRARLGLWIDCITRRLRLEEQVAVLLADVHGYCDKASAAELSMTLPSFKLLLHGARSRLNAIAGGSCVLLRRADAGARGECEEGGVPVAARSPAGVVASRPANSPTHAGPDPARCHCSDQRLPGSSVGSACSRCCFRLGDCLSTRCCFGVNCRLGIKCCRRVPNLLALRTKLLEPLTFN